VNEGGTTALGVVPVRASATNLWRILALYVVSFLCLQRSCQAAELSFVLSSSFPCCGVWKGWYTPQRTRKVGLAKVVLMRKMVLIADDNTFIRHALFELFKRELDFDVCGVAENGQEAIELAARLRPDLIVLDLSMPVMNGLDAALVLKRLMPSVPLMLYSAFDDRAYERRARALRISELVSKSERFSVLVDKARGLVYPNAS